jgi:hypothetical protein
LSFLGDNFVFNVTSDAIAGLDENSISIGKSDWAFQASGAAQVQHAAPNGIEFQENEACSAFDETLDPRMLLVGEGHDNTVKVSLSHIPSGDVEFVSADTTIATVSPSQATGATTTLTIHGVNAGVVTGADPVATSNLPILITARRITNPAIATSLRVVVKPEVRKTVEIFSARETDGTLVPGNVPTAGAFMAYLNADTWGKQANVFFTVNEPVDMPVHYDLLPAAQSGHPQGDGLLNDFHATNAPFTEAQALVLGAVARMQQLNRGSIGPDHLISLYVQRIGPPAACTSTPQHPCKTEVDGLTVQSSSLAMTQAPASFPAGEIHNSRVNVSAHELGHAMGADDLMGVANQKYLMFDTEDGLNQCRIKRDDWIHANPTRGDH